MTSLPGDIEMEVADRATAREETLIAALRAYFVAKDAYEKIDPIVRSGCVPAGLHIKDLEAMLRDILDGYAALSPAQRSSIPNHPEGGK